MQVFLPLLEFFIFFCCNTEATETEFSLFHQSDYDLKIERATVETFNNSYMKHAKLDAVPYNRTYRAFNGSLEIRLDLTKQIVIGVTTGKFLSNEYRFFPMTFEFDLCTEYTNDGLGLKKLFDGVSNINPCYFKKDVKYHIINAMPDQTKFPPHIPFGRYKLNLNIIDKKNRNRLAVMVVHTEIKEKPLNWEG